MTKKRILRYFIPAALVGVLFLSLPPFYLLHEVLLQVRSLPVFLQDQGRNKFYNEEWRIRSHPFWIDETTTGHIEERMYQMRREFLHFKPDAYPAKTEFWLIEEEAAALKRNEVILFVQPGIQPGKDSNRKRREESSGIKGQQYRDELFLMWERYHAGTKHYFALLKNNRVVWSNASPRKGRLLPGDCTPLVFDWRERKLLCLRELDPDELRRPDLWWFSKNEGLAPQGLVDQRDTDFYRRIIELGRGPSESEIQRWIFSKGITFYQYLTFLWVGDHLFALQWKSEDKVIELYELEFKDSIIEKKRSVTPSEHPCLGAALSPSGDFIALGNIGLFEFSTKDGVGKKRKDLDLIYPAWAPSGKKVVGLGENPEKDKGLYSGTYYNTLKVYPFPANP